MLSWVEGLVLCPGLAGRVAVGPGVGRRPDGARGPVDVDSRALGGTAGGDRRRAGTQPVIATGRAPEPRIAEPFARAAAGAAARVDVVAVGTQRAEAAVDL